MILSFVPFLASAVAGAASTPAREADTPNHAVRSLYRALAADDGAAASRLTSPDFYAFDGGRRKDARAIFEQLKALRRSGTIVEWNIGPIDVHESGRMAWAAWRNTGAVGQSGATRPVNWLESANLHRVGHTWVIDFLTSAREISAAAAQ